MLSAIRWLLKNLPTFLLAFILAVVVWISAVTSSDPTEERVYPYPVPIKILGKQAGLIITNDPPTNSLTLTLRGPKSVLDRLQNERTHINAYVNLENIEEGIHILPVQVEIAIQPIQIVAQSPETITIELTKEISVTLPIRLIRRGEAAIGFEAQTPIMSHQEAVVKGPSNLVLSIKEIRAYLEMYQANEDIHQTLPLQAVDEEDKVVNGVSINPNQISVTQPITQLGGYRTLVVKVNIKGQIATGYRLTSIQSFPATVTVFSSSPSLIAELPGFVETEPVDVNGLKDDLDIQAGLILPEGISVVGDPYVNVQVGVAAIESSLSLTGLPVKVIGLSSNAIAAVSLEKVDLILSGPLPLLEKLSANQIQVIIDLTDKIPGTYQIVPIIELPNSDLKVESLLPESIEVTIATKPTPTSTAAPVNLNPSFSPTITTTPTITFTPTITLTPTLTRAPTFTNTPITPTNTRAPTRTPNP